jgi:hypothetical protein
MATTSNAVTLRRHIGQAEQCMQTLSVSAQLPCSHKPADSYVCEKHSPRLTNGAYCINILQATLCPQAVHAVHTVAALASSHWCQLLSSQTLSKRGWLANEQQAALPPQQLQLVVTVMSRVARHAGAASCSAARGS